MSAPIIDKAKNQKSDHDDQDRPLDQEEKLETGLEDSMDASDPPAVTAPGDHGDPVPSSGFPEKSGERKPV